MSMDKYEIDVRECFVAWRNVIRAAKAAGVPDRMIDIGCITHIAMLVLGQEQCGNNAAREEVIEDIVSVYTMLTDAGFARNPEQAERQQQVVEEIDATSDANPGILGPDGKPIPH